MIECSRTQQDASRPHNRGIRQAVDLLASSTDIGAIRLRHSAADIFKNNSYVVCAITESLDLTGPEFARVDFSNVRVIDDSQPGAVDRLQLERLGGSVFWVAGKDASVSKFMTRDGHYTHGVPYNYGDNSGLWGETTEFACGLEAATVAACGNARNAVNHRVEYRDVNSWLQIRIRSPSFNEVTERILRR